MLFLLYVLCGLQHLIHLFIIYLFIYLFISPLIYLFIQLFNILNVLVISSDESTVTGYVHLISPVQTSHKNTGIKYFDMALQTSQNESVRLVCYSPEKKHDFTAVPRKATSCKDNKCPNVSKQKVLHQR